MSDSQKFADLGRPRRIWAISAIHGESARLAALHEEIAGRHCPGDRIVYLGNYLGYGPDVVETIDELVEFRRALLARPGMIVADIVYLRGCQEEMWHKLLQLHLAPNPPQVMDWMLRNGVDATLAAYGVDREAGLGAAREGAVALARWTNALRMIIRSAPGHENLMNALRRAAYVLGAGIARTGPDGSWTDNPAVAGPPAGLLFVSAGLDVNRSLAGQGDSFWWGGAGFARIDRSYGPFRRVVRGFDPLHGGVQVGDFAVSLDGGCGFGGHLVAGLFTPGGDLLELVEA